MSANNENDEASGKMRDGGRSERLEQKKKKKMKTVKCIMRKIEKWMIQEEAS